MMRYYSSTAGEMTLTADVASSELTIGVDSTVGLPVSFPYTLVLDVGAAAEEIVEVSAASGGTLTVSRGVDGTSAQAHSLGAKVRHMMTARDLRESRQHEAATVAHGVAGDVVGTSDVQTLTHKDLSDPTNVLPADLATDTEVATAVSDHAALTATHGATGEVVGTTNAQTLTNKTISGASNTLSNIPESAVTNLTADLAALDTRLDTLEAGGAVITNAFTAAADFTINTQQLVKVGRVVQVYLNVTYTGGGFTSDSRGDIANASVATAASSAYWPLVPAGFSNSASGILMAGGIWTDGSVSISATIPGITTLSGANYSFTVTYLTAA
jgi:hypothetical protein